MEESEIFWIGKKCRFENIVNVYAHGMLRLSPSLRLAPHDSWGPNFIFNQGKFIYLNSSDRTISYPYEKISHPIFDNFCDADPATTMSSCPPRSSWHHLHPRTPLLFKKNLYVSKQALYRMVHGPTHIKMAKYALLLRKMCCGKIGKILEVGRSWQ